MDVGAHDILIVSVPSIQSPGTDPHLKDETDSEFERMTTTRTQSRPTLRLRSRRATQAQEPRPDPEGQREPEPPSEPSGAAGSAGAAPTGETGPEKTADKAPKSFTVFKLWKRAVAAYSRGNDSVSEWACTVLDAAAGQAEGEGGTKAATAQPGREA